MGPFVAWHIFTRLLCASVCSSTYSMYTRGEVSNRQVSGFSRFVSYSQPMLMAVGSLFARPVMTLE